MVFRDFAERNPIAQQSHNVFQRDAGPLKYWRSTQDRRIGDDSLAHRSQDSTIFAIQMREYDG